VGLTGLTFLGHVIIGELLVGERPTLGHHGGVDILAIGGADGHGAAVTVNVPRFAAHVPPSHQLHEFAPGRDAAGPRHTLDLAGLGLLRGVDAVKPDALAGYVDGVAVNDPCRAGDVLGYCWRRKQQEGGSNG